MWVRGNDSEKPSKTATVVNFAERAELNVFTGFACSAFVVFLFALKVLLCASKYFFIGVLPVDICGGHLEDLTKSLELNNIQFGFRLGG